MRRGMITVALVGLSVTLALAEEKKPSYKSPDLPKTEIAKLAGVWVGGTSDLVSDVDGARVGWERSGLKAPMQFPTKSPTKFPTRKGLKCRENDQTPGAGIPPATAASGPAGGTPAPLLDVR